jgi:hypothetical protein
MRKRISNRIEALERAADREAFASAWPWAIAYYLGGAKHPSEVMLGYASALGYTDLDALCGELADLFKAPSGLKEHGGILGPVLN